MSVKKVAESSEATVYKKTDDTPLIGTGSTSYAAKEKGSNARGTGKTADEALEHMRAVSNKEK